MEIVWLMTKAWNCGINLCRYGNPVQIHAETYWGSLIKHDAIFVCDGLWSSYMNCMHVLQFVIITIGLGLLELLLDWLNCEKGRSGSKCEKRKSWSECQEKQTNIFSGYNIPKDHFCVWPFIFATRISLNISFTCY